LLQRREESLDELSKQEAQRERRAAVVRHKAALSDAARRAADLSCRLWETAKRAAVQWGNIAHWKR
jgi:hypothetical protein